MKTLIKISPYIATIILAIILFRSCNRTPEAKISTGDKTVEVRLVTKVDTLYITKNIYHRDTIKVPTLIRQDTIFKEGTKDIVLIPAIKRVYQDSIRVEDSVYVGYKANTTGTLDRINLSYSNRKSIVVIHKTDSVFTNTTITKPSKGVYLGLDAGIGEISPTLMYNHGSNNYGVKYNLINKGVGITYSRKIF